MQHIPTFTLIGTCEASRFNSIRKSCADSQIFESAVPAHCSIARRNQTIQTINGAQWYSIYRLASSMSDHTPVLFNVFEDWNEESVVPHISFYSIRIRFECSKRPIRRSLNNTIQYSTI